MSFNNAGEATGYSIGWVNSEGDSGWGDDSFFYDYRVTVQRTSPPPKSEA